ncbi:hypothetical protein [Pseudoalteromonas piscicida]|uniref:hypothetical protein n=1 Tax=Pseudoalteromonas piscicida TaxID=43662 RepID=UPI001C93AD82|nr:hypothetical protein [Pseudoalteromonas piscicida]QZO11648.1 hypothetical protein K5642_10930 [Pseudoalteromonas piscicida]
MRKSYPNLILALLVISISFAVSASASIENKYKEPIERIEVYGEKPRYILKFEMEDAKKDFYDLYNKLTEDDSFKTKCEKKARLGSKIKSFGCETRFTKSSFHNITKQHIQLNTDLRHPAAALRYLSMPDISDVYSVTNTKRKAHKEDIFKQINENPELKEAFIHFAKKYTAYESK